MLGIKGIFIFVISLDAEQFWYCVGSHLIDLNLDETKLATGITNAGEWCMV